MPRINVVTAYILTWILLHGLLGTAASYAQNLGAVPPLFPHEEFLPPNQTEFEVLAECGESRAKVIFRLEKTNAKGFSSIEIDGQSVDEPTINSLNERLSDLVLPHPRLIVCTSEKNWRIDISGSPDGAGEPGTIRTFSIKFTGTSLEHVLVWDELPGKTISRK